MALPLLTRKLIETKLTAYCDRRFLGMNPCQRQFGYCEN